MSASHSSFRIPCYWQKVTVSIPVYRPVKDDSNQELPLHGQNQWPSEAEVPSFRTKVQKWMETMLKLGRILVLATGVGLGMDDGELEDLLSLVDESFWVMR